MSTDAAAVAERLLDAQVEYLLGELSGPRLAQVIERDVDDLLGLAAKVTVADVVDPSDVQALVRRLVDRTGGSTLLAELVQAVADAVYDLSASQDHTLGEVVDRDPVEALVAKVLSMRQLHDRALDRMAESPLVATVATRFVSKIVADFVQQNRERAERLPGMSSLLSLGTSAAARVRSATVDQFLGDAAGRSTQFAIRHTNNALRELMREAPLQGAAMEIWDLHADEPIGDLREYLSKQDLRELAVLVHEIIGSARGTEYAGELLDECVAVFFERYGERDLASLLPELGITRDDVAAEAARFVPRALEAARSTGALAQFVRARLAPFYASEQVRAILAGAELS